MIDLTPIMEAIIALVAAVITAFMIPWLKGKIDADKLEKIELWVTVAVEAAEQLYVGSGRGAEKKAYVVQFLQEKGGLSQILCKHRNAVQIEQNLFKAEVAQAAAALFSK